MLKNYPCPRGCVQQIEEKQKLETSPIVSNMMQKDAGMSKLLYRKGLNDDEKNKLYHANLERYLDVKHQKDNTTPRSKIKSWLCPKKRRNFQIRLLWKVFLKQCVQEQLRF